MQRGLDPLLTPVLLHALASMGHGDGIAVVDANFPAAAMPVESAAQKRDASTMIQPAP
jgi:L-fucose mutarotase